MTVEKIINEAWENKDQVNQNSDQSLKDAINKMIHFLSKRDYVGKIRNNSVDIRPVGTYKHYQDKIAPSDFYEYIQRHTTHPHEENLISYMAKSNKQDTKIRYPFNYIFYSKNVLPEAA